MKKIIVLVVILIAMISCKKIDEGKVVEKWHEPATNTLMLIPQKIGDITITQQYWVYDDEDFCVKIEGLNQKGKIKKKTLYLDKKMWETVDVGQNIIINDKNWTKDEDKKTKAEE